MKSYKNIISFILITTFFLCSFNIFAQELTFTTVTEALNYTGADKATATKITITGQISGPGYSANSEWRKFRTLNETFPSLAEIEILTDQNIPSRGYYNGSYISLFYADYWLKTFLAPNITTIGDYAFDNCRGLTTIDFPKVTTIGHYAFDSCVSLTTANFPEAKNIGGNAFYECLRLTTANFPEAINIYLYAFYNCKSLTTIDFPKVTTIGHYAFNSCENLTTADFPLATSIGERAFRFCYSLTTIDFPKVTIIGNSAFYNCESLITISTVNFPLLTNINNSVFSGCENLTTANFPLVTTIGGKAFYNCENLTTANFPLVTTIGEGAFLDCQSLTNLSFPLVTTIENFVFYGCKSLTTASFGTALTTPTTIILNNDRAFTSSPNIDLTLGKNVLPVPDLTNMTWNGYTWKSINVLTSITENPLISNIQISPNPVSSASNIEIYSVENQPNTTINIVDISGREITNIYSGTLNEGKMNFPISINLINGSYFLLIKNENGQKIKSFVVAK